MTTYKLDIVLSDDEVLTVIKTDPAHIRRRLNTLAYLGSSHGATLTITPGNGAPMQTLAGPDLLAWARDEEKG